MDKGKPTEIASTAELPATPLYEGMDITTREAFAGMMKTLSQCAEAMQQLAIQQKLQSERMEALERAVRLNMPMTRTQTKYLGDAMKTRCRDILAKKGLDGDKKASQKLTARMKKAVLTRYGVRSLSDIPRHEYPVAMQQIDTWNDAVAIIEIVREARSKAAREEGTQDV